MQRNTKGAPGILGPGETKQDGFDVDLPDCVVMKTQKDADEFKEFVTQVVKAANENALNVIAEFVVQQNAAMAQLVKKLGAS